MRLAAAAGLYKQLQDAQQVHLQATVALTDRHRSTLRRLLDEAAAFLLPKSTDEAKAPKEDTAEHSNASTAAEHNLPVPAASPALHKAGDKRKQHKVEPAPSSKRTRAARQQPAAGISPADDSVAAPSAPTGDGDTTCTEPSGTQHAVVDQAPAAVTKSRRTAAPATSAVPFVSHTAARATRSRAAAAQDLAAQVQAQAPEPRQQPARRRQQKLQQQEQGEAGEDKVQEEEEQRSRQPSLEDTAMAQGPPAQQTAAELSIAAEASAALPQRSASPEQPGVAEVQAAAAATASVPEVIAAAAQKPGRQRKQAARNVGSGAARRHGSATQQQEQAAAKAQQSPTAESAPAGKPACSLQEPPPAQEETPASVTVAKGQPSPALAGAPAVPLPVANNTGVAAVAVADWLPTAAADAQEPVEPAAAGKASAAEAGVGEPTSTASVPPVSEQAALASAGHAQPSPGEAAALQPRSAQAMPGPKDAEEAKVAGGTPDHAKLPAGSSAMHRTLASSPLPATPGADDSPVADARAASGGSPRAPTHSSCKADSGPKGPSAWETNDVSSSLSSIDQGVAVMLAAFEEELASVPLPADAQRAALAPTAIQAPVVPSAVQEPNTQKHSSGEDSPQQLQRSQSDAIPCATPGEAVVAEQVQEAERSSFGGFALPACATAMQQQHADRQANTPAVRVQSPSAAVERGQSGAGPEQQQNQKAEGSVAGDSMDVSCSLPGSPMDIMAVSPVPTVAAPRDLSFGDGLEPMPTLPENDSESPVQQGSGQAAQVADGPAAACDFGASTSVPATTLLQTASAGASSLPAADHQEAAAVKLEQSAGAGVPPTAAGVSRPGGSNLVAAVRSFLPAKRVLSPQVAAGKKQVKVRALEAAQASKRAEEAKAAERVRAKEGLKQQNKLAEADAMQPLALSSPVPVRGATTAAGGAGLVKLKAAAFQQRIQQDEETRRAEESKKWQDKDAEARLASCSNQQASNAAPPDKQQMFVAPIAGSKARRPEAGTLSAGGHVLQAAAVQQAARPDVNDKLKRAEQRRKDEEERRRAELEAKQKVKEDRTKAARQAASVKPEPKHEVGRPGLTTWAAAAEAGAGPLSKASAAQAAGAKPVGAALHLQPRSLNVTAVSTAMTIKKEGPGPPPPAEKGTATALAAARALALAATTTPGVRRARPADSEAQVPGAGAAGTSQQPPMTPAELAQEERNIQNLVASPYVSAGAQRTPGLRAGATNQVLNYEISPYRSDSDDDDEAELEAKKPIPDWAQASALLSQLHKQRLADPDKLFGGQMRTISLEDIFGGMAPLVLDPVKASKRRDWRRRGSSGDWIQDRLTWQEEVGYKRAMGLC